MKDCCSDKTGELDILRQRQTSTLKIVLAINAVMFLIEFMAGLSAGSASLLSDSLDMLGDALAYGFTLYAVAKTQRIKAISALVKGAIMAVFGLMAVGQVIYKLAVPLTPSFEIIGGIGLLALAANVICFAVLSRHRTDDINMNSVWLCSRNDIIANVAVILAALGIWITHHMWPDIIVGLAIAVLFLKSAVTVLSGAARELRESRATGYS